MQVKQTLSWLICQADLSPGQPKESFLATRALESLLRVWSLWSRQTDGHTHSFSPSSFSCLLGFCRVLIHCW